MSDHIYYIKGDFVPASRASIPVTDLGFLRGAAVFETLRTYSGVPFKLDSHLDRLFNSAKLISLSLQWSKSHVEDIVKKTLLKNNFTESVVRIIITAGETDDFFTPKGGASLLVLVKPLVKYPKSIYEDGINTLTEVFERDIPEAKTIYYVPGQIALSKAKEKDSSVGEIIYINRSSFVTEGIISNVFVFKNNTLATPDLNLLKGVTRQTVLDIGKSMFNVEERNVSLDELINSDEVFLTSSIREIVPVVKINDKIIGNGKPGKSTRQIMKAFYNFTRKKRD